MAPDLTVEHGRGLTVAFRSPWFRWKRMDSALLVVGEFDPSAESGLDEPAEHAAAVVAKADNKRRALTRTNAQGTHVMPKALGRNAGHGACGIRHHSGVRGHYCLGSKMQQISLTILDHLARQARLSFEVGPPRLVALQPVATRQRVLVAHDNLGYFPAGGNELESASTFECHAAPRLRLNVGYLFERRHESVATVNGQSVGPKFCLSSVVMLSASSTLPGGSPNTDSVLDRRSHDKVCRTPLFHSALKVVPSVWMEPPFHDSLRRHAHDITSCDGPGRRFHDIERRFRMGPQEATVPAFGNTLRRRHE